MASKLTEETISGYDTFKKRIEELKTEKKGQKIIVLFTGNKTSGGHNSWCPDCNDLEKIFSTYKTKHNLEGHLLTVEVGNRDEWKSKECPFRTDRLLRLSSIPTLLVWGTPKKLFGDAVLSEETLNLLFNDDDD